MSEPGAGGGLAEGLPAGGNELSGTVFGPVVQARSVHGGIHVHGGGAPGMPVPAQLPAVPAHFTGRAAELAALSGLLDADPLHPVAIAVIAGVGGAGKTSLALRWLGEVGARFADGALYAGLAGGRLEEAERPAEVLGQFLRALGVASERVPAGLGEAAALWRSMTAGRRLALLLDDAASAAQVRALLPAAGPSLVVVTSRRRLGGLALTGAHFTELGPLSEADAVELLDRVAGGRAGAEPEAARAVAALCGRLPLALSVSAARLAVNPRWRLQRVAEELAVERDRLAVLSLEEVSVQAAFDVSYRALSAAVARAYRLLALLPGPDFSAGLAAAGTAGSTRETAWLLEALTEASLLEETAEGRFRFHDLVRLHAREQAAAEAGAEYDEVTGRAVAWYLSRAVAADLVVIPGRWQLGPGYPQAKREPPAFPDAAEALAWLEAELPGLEAAVSAAHETDRHAQAWQLCEALWGLLLYRRHYAVWIAVTQTGLASARACADQRAQARMRDQLGFAFLCLHQYERAGAEFSAAVDLARAAADRLGEAAPLEHLGLALRGLGRTAEALRLFQEARATHEELGRPRGVALMTRRLGEALSELGRHEEAVSALAEARLRFAELPDPYNEARSATEQARALLRSGRGAEVPGLLQAALAVMTSRGATGQQAAIWVMLADAAEAAGDDSAARGYLETALDLYRDGGGPEGPQVLKRLAHYRPGESVPDEQGGHGQVGV